VDVFRFVCAWDFDFPDTPILHFHLSDACVVTCETFVVVVVVVVELQLMSITITTTNTREPSHGMTAHYPNRYRYRDRDRFTLQFDIDSDTDFDFDEALANTNKSKMINGGRRDWRLPSTKQSKNVHFFELWDHCEKHCSWFSRKEGLEEITHRTSVNSCSASFRTVNCLIRGISFCWSAKHTLGKRLTFTLTCPVTESLLSQI
jgi:hypothetical protein